jgi:putative FmdB family regulatory protein
MPTYEYVCPQCGIFEQFHSITTVIQQCPKCGGEVHRIISRNQNIIFKGSGFHVTDNRSGDYNKQAASENSAGAVSTTTNENKSNENKSNENKSAKTETKAS